MKDGNGGSEASVVTLPPDPPKISCEVRSLSGALTLSAIILSWRIISAIREHSQLRSSPNLPLQINLYIIKQMVYNYWKIYIVPSPFAIPFSMTVIQKRFQLPAYPRGCHLITRHILEQAPEISSISAGLLSVFIQHTSASLTINENADSDVRRDLGSLLDSWAPESFSYLHQEEGGDDMPAHGKASLMGASVTIPITNGRLALGVWQGVYLCEHRNHGGRRSIVLTIIGE